MPGESTCLGKGEERKMLVKADELSFAVNMMCRELEHCDTLITIYYFFELI